MRFNKGLLKFSAIGLGIILAGISIFLVLYSQSSQALADKQVYTLSEKVKINLGNEVNYTLKIESPSGEYMTKGYGSSFVLKPELPGHYRLTINYEANKSYYAFDVIDSSEEKNVSYGELVDADSLLSFAGVNDTKALGEFSTVSKSKPPRVWNDSQIVINRPVRWKINYTFSNNGESVKIPLPKQGRNISAKSGKGGNLENISVNMRGEKLFDRISRLAAGGKPRQYAVFDNVKNDLEITYYTPAPESREENISSREKVVRISDPDEMGYKDVLAYTDLPEKVPDSSEIKIYWKEEGRFLDFESFDTDGDGLLDYVEWNVPHLSNQTFEIIIAVVQASHLDENRLFLSDIYSSVKELDGNWSETIPDEHYVRVTFERNLTKENDITLYPSIISGIPSIEVYEKDDNILIANFTSLNDNVSNKIFLTGLSRSQNAFDLHVVGGSVKFDYITDPSNITLIRYTFPAGNFAPTTTASNITGSTLTNTQGLGTWEISSNGYGSDPELRVGPVANAVSMPAAITYASYFTFNITPSRGYSMNLTNLNFLVARGGASTPRGWGITSSIDNYATILFNVNVTSQRATWTAQTNTFDNSFKNLNSTVTFRFYIYSPGTGSTLEIDNLTITGDTFLSLDSTAPAINLTYPLNITYTPNISALNYTVSDANLRACWYSINLGAANTTINCGTNVTGLTSTEGSNIWTVWANDSFGNEDSSSVTFFKDTVFPQLHIDSPSNATFTSNANLGVNYTYSDSNPGRCWWTNSSGTYNYSLANCGTNITGQTWKQGLTTVVIYANDSAGNLNSSFVSFSVDSALPVVNVVYPSNATTYTTDVSNLNYTISDATPSRCWWTNSSGAWNSTSTPAGANFSNVISNEGWNTWAVYCNDSLNNINSSTVTFFEDAIPLGVTILSPQNITYGISPLSFNVTLNDEGDSCKLSLNNWQTNYTLTKLNSTYFNYTNSSIGQGSYAARFWCNDTTGGVNSTSAVYFTTIAPSLILFYDGVTIPANWTCISCNSSDEFYNRLPLGNSSYGATGGAATHNHNITVTSVYGSDSVGRATGNGARSTPGHIHPTTPSIAAASNLPPYRNIKVIKYNNGIPAILPAGAIAVFNSTSLDEGWTRYSVQDGLFIRGQNNTNAGGAATHNHTVDVTLETSGDEIGSGGNNNGVADNSHQHTASGDSDNVENIPPYITVILAKADGDTIIPEGMIGMFNAAPTSLNWIVKSNPGGDFYGRFIMGNSSYGDTDGRFDNHAHANLSIQSDGPDSTANEGSGTRQIASNVHTHTVNVTFDDDPDIIPPYKEVVFAYAWNISVSDNTFPSISIISPQSRQYNTSIISFNVSVGESGSWCKFSLDSMSNVTMTKRNSTYFNYTKEGIREGNHNLTFYCSDISGNVNYTSTNFSVFLSASQLVRRGSSTIASGSSSATYYINVSDVSKAFLAFSSRTDDSTPNDNQVTGNLLGDRIVFQRYGTGGAVTIWWEVVEHPDIYVQREESYYDSSTAGQLVYPDDINTSASFLIVTNRLNSNTADYNYMGFWSGDILNENTLNFTRGGSGVAGTLSWQAVEWSGSRVREGTSYIPVGSRTVDSSFSPSLNISRSFLIFSRTSNVIGQDGSLVGGYFYNSTTARFYRRGAVGSNIITWYAVENGEFYSQSGITFLAASTAPVNVTLQYLNISSAFSLTSLDAQGNSNTYARSQQTHHLENGTILQFQKANANNNQNNSWFVIEFGRSYASLISNYTPRNNSFYSTSTLDFNVLLSRSGSWCGYSLDNGANATMTRFNSTYFNYTKTGLTDRQHNLTFYCNDTSNVFGRSDFIIFNVDTSLPSVSLISPNDNTINSTTNTIKLFYNVTSNSQIANCSLLLNNEPVINDNTITQGISQYFEPYMPVGNYTWSVNCTSMTGNQNNSGARHLNVTVQIVNNWQRRFYESSTGNFTGATAEINLANARDSEENRVSMSVAPLSLSNLVIAQTPFFGNNGVLIPANTQVNFSAYGLTTLDNFLYASWFFYSSNNSGDRLICSSGDNYTGGARIINGLFATSSCSAGGSDIRLQASDRFKLVINVWNNYSSAVTYNHSWDSNRNSFVELTGLIVYGGLYTELSYPTTGRSIALNEILNVSCGVNCSIGNCTNTQVYVQQNTSSNGWQNIAASGNLILAGTETNPHSFSNIINSTIITNFSLRGNGISSNNIRCIGISDYSRYNGTVTRQVNVTVGNNPPEVALISPGNGYWFNSANINLSYNISDIDNNLAGCSLYINGALNQTNSTSIRNGLINNFTLNNWGDGQYNWTVNCTDTSGLSDSDSERYFFVDSVKPTVNLLSPPNNNITSYSTLSLNFSVSDNLDEILDCNLTVNSVVRRTNIAVSNGSVSNTTLIFGLGLHFWNVTCWDNASNINTSATWSFNVSDTPPAVNLTSPINGYWSNVSEVLLYYNATDNNGFSSCALYINGALNQTNSTSIRNGLINNFTFSAGNGVYNWTVNCTDTSRYSDTDDIRSLYIDLEKPRIFLNKPDDMSVFTTSAVDVNFTATDNLDFGLSCNLSLNSIVIYPNIEAQNGSIINRQATGLTNGRKFWNVTCWDNASNINTSATWSFNVSVTPSVALSTQNNSWFGLGEVVLNYTPLDNLNFSACALYINGALNQTNSTSIRNGLINNFTLNNWGDGQYNWSVNCTDTFRLSNMSEQRVFYRDTIPPRISLWYPASDQGLYLSIIPFNFTAYDNFDPSLSCNLTVDGRVVNASFESPNGAVTNLNATLSAAEHFWNVTCWDNASNINTSATWNFTNYEAPRVNLVSPDNFEWLATTDNTLTYNIFDPDNNIANCSLYINGALNQSNQSEIINDAENSFDFDAEDGAYNWSVACWDKTGLDGESQEWRFYTDTHKPNLTVNNPGLNEILDWNSVTFNVSVNDNMDENISCTLNLNYFPEVSNVNVTNGTDFIHSLVRADGFYEWQLDCLDNANNLGTTSLMNFTIEAPPNVTLISPENGNRTTLADITFTYFTEDSIGLENCRFYFDEALNQTEDSPNLNGEGSFFVEGVNEGNHNWTVNCTDSDGNTFEPPVRNITRDTTPPIINLIAPSNASTIDYNLQEISLNWSVEDALDNELGCNLTIDGHVNMSIYNITDGSILNVSIYNSSTTLHAWNVTCWDRAGNIDTTPTWVFNTAKPNLMINSSYIYLNNSQPTENESIVINATIRNLINVSTNEILVQFFNGDPLSGGEQIGSNQVIDVIGGLNEKNVSVVWNTVLGTSLIFVVIDPFGSISETDESDNRANRSIATGSWEYVYGDINTNSQFELGGSRNQSLVTWPYGDFTSGNIYVTDSESSISWTSLQPIGRTVGGAIASNDLEDLDSLLNMTQFYDSVNKTYANSSGNIANTSSITVFNKIISNIPIANSTNNSNFVTGILWDSSGDHDSQYSISDKEEIVFVAPLKKDSQGTFGNYDYEIRIPARLREYRNVDTQRVSFYSEII